MTAEWTLLAGERPGPSWPPEGELVLVAEPKVGRVEIVGLRRWTEPVGPSFAGPWFDDCGQEAVRPLCADGEEYFWHPLPEFFGEPLYKNR